MRRRIPEYLANQTQPSRDQPWYHVLVHDSEQITHAAQTSLQADDSDQQISHPLVEHFFSSFNAGWLKGAEHVAGHMATHPEARVRK